MGMNGIRTFGFAILVAGGSALTSCGDPQLQMLENNNRNIVMKSGIRADKFLKLDDSIGHIKAKGLETEGAFSALRALAWQKEIDKINKKHIIDSTRNATRKAVLDSVELAKKACKHL